MNPMVTTLLWTAIKLVFVAGALLYSFLVLTSYASEGARYTLHVDLTDPARSAQHLMVWLGVRAVSGIVGGARSFLDLLCEASADVGTWVIDNSSPQIREKVRSRFL